MTVIENEQQQKPTPTIRTLEQKIEQLTKSVDELRKLHNTYASKRKVVKNMIREIRQLALDLNVDEKELRMMISRSFDMAGISKSWQRKLLPESLKFINHTRKDYLERQQQLEQQPLMKPPQQLQPSD
jgi:DNA repair ATPase RecN